MFDSSAMGVIVCLWAKVGYAINDDQAHAAHTAPMFMQLMSVPKVWKVHVAYLCWESQSIQFGKSLRFAETNEKPLKFHYVTCLKLHLDMPIIRNFNGFSLVSIMKFQQMIKDKKRKQWNKWQENKVLKWILKLIETHFKLINDWKIRQALR
jgi:hypothetical protein